MVSVNRLFRPTSKLTGILAISALAWSLATICLAGPVAPTKKEPLLFVSERKDVHLHAEHARENFFKVVQGLKTSYGTHLKDSDALITESDFYAHIDAARKADPNVPIVIFVHGCCVSFGEQMGQADALKNGIDSSYGRVAPGKNAVVMTYDWAAPFSYATSLVHASDAQSRFDVFMRGMVTRYGSANITIVAHSLGTLLVQNFVERIPDGAKFDPFKSIVFSRADLDRQSFADCLPDLKRFSGRLMVLSSDNDPNIYFSSLLRRWGLKLAQVVVLPARVTAPLVKRYDGENPEVGVAPVGIAGDDAPPPGEAVVTGPISDKQRHKMFTRRLGQVKVAREFGPTIEVYDLSSFRVGHAIPYQFIGGLIFNDFTGFKLKKEPNSVVTVHRARP